MTGFRWIESNQRPCGFETDTHSNIKADKAAITKRPIYPPHISRGILIVLEISLFESSPQGRRETIAALRIQTAANGVNGL
jgi:hypothetical protein